MSIVTFFYLVLFSDFPKSFMYYRGSKCKKHDKHSPLLSYSGRNPQFGCISQVWRVSGLRFRCCGGPARLPGQPSFSRNLSGTCSALRAPSGPPHRSTRSLLGLMGSCAPARLRCACAFCELRLTTLTRALHGCDPSALSCVVAHPHGCDGCCCVWRVERGRAEPVRVEWAPYPDAGRAGPGVQTLGTGRRQPSHVHGGLRPSAPSLRKRPGSQQRPLWEARLFSGLLCAESGGVM